MALSHLLDTNVLSDLVRNPQGAVASRIAALGEAAVCTSIIVASELRYGACKAGSQALAERVDLLLSAIEVLPLEAPADRRYGELRDALTRRGEIIGPNDLLIAAQALVMDLTLVSANVREFSRVPGLRLEDWLGS
jgi:tRNA(fMet)-specific endonuclease VapC